MDERQKWNAKKKGYLKIHVAIDIKKVSSFIEGN